MSQTVLWIVVNQEIGKEMDWRKDYVVRMEEDIGYSPWIWRLLWCDQISGPEVWVSEYIFHR
jgi:hypothetical protein